MNIEQMASYDCKQYAEEVFKWSKEQIVKTPEKCVEVENKIREILKVRERIKSFPQDPVSQYADHYIEAALNFATKAYNSYARVISDLEKKQEELERVRRANQEKVQGIMDERNEQIRKVNAGNGSNGEESNGTGKKEMVVSVGIEAPKKRGRPRKDK